MLKAPSSQHGRRQQDIPVNVGSGLGGGRTVHKVTEKIRSVNPIQLETGSRILDMLSKYSTDEFQPSSKSLRWSLLQPRLASKPLYP